MAKKKKPVEPVEVVEIEEPVVEEVAVDEGVDTAAVSVEPDLIEHSEMAHQSDHPSEDTQVASEIITEKTQKSNFGPLVLGGAVAAVIGFMAARSDVIDNFLPPSWRMGSSELALQQQLDSTQSQLASVSEKLASISSELENAPESQTVDNGLSEALVAQLDDLTDRIAKLEDRPATSSTSAPDFSGEFLQLREAAQKQQAEIDALLADARLAEETSLEAASKTLARAAATRVVAAIETGAPFSGALDDLKSAGAVEIPAELEAVASNGVVTLAALQAAIPGAARDALSASPVDEEGGIGSFLKRQLGARSVAPREGNDTDAILSRVEGAVRAGRLTDALAEADTLPEGSKSAMADWIESAKSRLAVTSASETLMQRLAAN